MNEVEVLDISREAIFTLVKVVTPVLLVALFIGLIPKFSVCLSPSSCFSLSC